MDFRLIVKDRSSWQLLPINAEIFAVQEEKVSSKRLYSSSVFIRLWNKLWNTRRAEVIVLRPGIHVKLHHGPELHPPLPVVSIYSSLPNFSSLSSEPWKREGRYGADSPFPRSVLTFKDDSVVCIIISPC